VKELAEGLGWLVLIYLSCAIPVWIGLGLWLFRSKPKSAG
jgi:hypothetical protein